MVQSFTETTSFFRDGLFFYSLIEAPSASCKFKRVPVCIRTIENLSLVLYFFNIEANNIPDIRYAIFSM